MLKSTSPKGTHWSLGKAAGEQGQVAGDSRPAQHDAARRGEAHVDAVAPVQAQVPPVSGVLEGGGQQHSVRLRDQDQGRAGQAPLGQLLPQGGQHRLAGKALDSHGAGEAADDAVALAVIVHREGEDQRQGLGLVQQRLGQLGHREEQVLQAGRIGPARNGEGLSGGHLGLSAGEGHQTDLDLLLVHLCHQHRGPVGQGAFGLEEGGEHGDGRNAAVQGHAHLGKEELGQGGAVQGVLGHAVGPKQVMQRLLGAGIHKQASSGAEKGRPSPPMVSLGVLYHVFPKGKAR